MWLQQGAATIPLRNAEAFTQLLDRKRLSFANGSEVSDIIDRTNSHLAASTIERGLRLMIVFPDTLSQRAPLLFATALVSQWWDRKKLGLSPGKIIYFGTTIGIRQHLSQTSVGNLSLNTVFPQQNPSLNKGTQGRRMDKAAKDISQLPEVICAYSPADAIALVKEVCPNWIAIDCGQEARIKWLPELLQYANEIQVPVVAWSYNPLSEAIADFERWAEAEVIRWPQRVFEANGPEITPLVIESSDTQYDQILREAYVQLSTASAIRRAGRLSKDALRIFWSLHRSLEQLSIPLGLFEKEADHYWGIQRITKLLNGAIRFLEALPHSSRQLSEQLSNVLTFHNQAIQLLQQTAPPMWTALTQLCVEKRSGGGGRTIVFSGPARKQMFVLALLARFNITEEELSEIDISLVTLNELRGSSLLSESGTSSLTETIGTGHEREVILAAIPSLASSSRILPLLSFGKVDILIYPYQINALARRIKDWNKRLTVSIETTEKVVSDRFGRTPDAASLTLHQTVNLGSSRAFSVTTGRTEKPHTHGPLVVPIDETSELRWLLEEDEAIETGQAQASVVPSQGQDGVTWVQNVLEIRFNGGWRGIFGLDDTLNVMTNESREGRVEEQFVRSIGVGDRVLFIHGQRRQSLYELIVSRVHNHPAIEMHLALISKWQEELAQSFRVNRAKGWTVEDVLTKIQRQGSSISSPQTIRLWMKGRILAPNDPQDLVRLARVMGLPFVEQYHFRIYRAAQRIRGLHIGLSNRLSHWLREQAKGGGESSSDIIDEELGLSFQDFKDSLAILAVKEVTEVSGLFLLQDLGKLEREEDAL
ncbi:MAG: hypothetical protein F4Y84_07250 [Caldilineaceae bacterium SB0665_bin_25]|nr:hypothetical protein [Caldilineaceae bacterium SB0665_bin_25]